jgi:hypothetical protein
MRARVFAVHQPTGRDGATGAIRPTMDLSPATEWGELRFILREFENPFTNIDATLAEVRRVLTDEGFCSDDWLLLVGNPVLIAVVATVAAELTGSLRVLQWNRSAHGYAPVELQLSTGDGPANRG